MDGHILVGKFGAPHGVRGELRLKSYTHVPLDIARYGALADGAGRRHALASARVVKDDILVVRLAGVTTRDGAAALTNVNLYVAREDLPVPDPDEFYHADLVGLRAHEAGGAPIGVVKAVHDHGGGAILEVAPTVGGDTHLYPFTQAVVPKIDIAGGTVTIVPPLETDGEAEA